MFLFSLIFSYLHGVRGKSPSRGCPPHRGSPRVAAAPAGAELPFTTRLRQTSRAERREPTAHPRRANRSGKRRSPTGGRGRAGAQRPGDRLQLHTTNKQRLLIKGACELASKRGGWGIMKNERQRIFLPFTSSPPPCFLSVAGFITPSDFL